MSPVDKYSNELEEVIADLAARIIAPRMSEFESVWDAANTICDRYHVGSCGVELPRAA